MFHIVKLLFSETRVFCVQSSRVKVEFVKSQNTEKRKFNIVNGLNQEVSVVCLV